MTLIEGNPRSAVRAVIFEDLQCGDCTRLRRMLDSELLPRFGASVAFEHHDFPLKKHDWARKAAAAARYFDTCVPAGLGLEFRRRTLELVKQLSLEMLPQHIRAFALEHGAAPAGAAEVKFAIAVENDFQAGRKRGVVKTPTVFVGETAFIEVFTADEVAAALEQALARGVVRA